MSGPRAERRRGAAPRSARAGAPGSARSPGRSQRLLGVRLVLRGAVRRGALARALETHRGLCEHGAELCVIVAPGSERSTGAALARFPWARAIAPGAVLAAVGDAGPPEQVLLLSTDVECDRPGLESMVRLLSSMPAGAGLVPGLKGPSGKRLEGLTTIDPPAWLARARDLSGLVRPRLHPCSGVHFTVPDAARFQQLEAAARSGCRSAAAVAPTPQRGSVLPSAHASLLPARRISGS